MCRNACRQHSHRRRWHQLAPRQAAGLPPRSCSANSLHAALNTPASTCTSSLASPRPAVILHNSLLLHSSCAFSSHTTGHWLGIRVGGAGGQCGRHSQFFIPLITVLSP